MTAPANICKKVRSDSSHCSTLIHSTNPKGPSVKKSRVNGTVICLHQLVLPQGPNEANYDKHSNRSCNLNEGNKPLIQTHTVCTHSCTQTRTHSFLTKHNCHWLQYTVWVGAWQLAALWNEGNKKKNEPVNWKKKKKKAVSALLRNKVPKISHLRFGFRDDQLFCAERSVGCISFVYIYIYISALELTSFVMCVTVTHKHPSATGSFESGRNRIAQTSVCNAASKD